MRSMKMLVAMAVLAAFVAGPVLAQPSSMSETTSGTAAPAKAKHHATKKHHAKKKTKKESGVKKESAPAETPAPADQEPSGE
jgi:Ni/Co efflux regulator RcnB